MSFSSYSGVLQGASHPASSSASASSSALASSLSPFFTGTIAADVVTGFNVRETGESSGGAGGD